MGVLCIVTSFVEVSILSMIWRSGNSIRHINEVILRRARLVLGLVTTFGGSTILVFIQAHSGPLSLAIPP